MRTRKPSSPETTPRKLRVATAPKLRPSVAVLLDYVSYLDGAYQSRIGEAFDLAAKKLDVDLQLLFGRALEEPNAFSRIHNGIFELIESGSTDAVVMVSTVLAAHCGESGLLRFAAGYAGLPRVSLGVTLPGVPSVVVDNVEAMQAMVEHVVGTHGRRRVAFLAGTPDSPESVERLLGYRRALERHGVAFDEALVGYGSFMHWPARHALAQLLERVGSIDALVAANDTMAMGAIAALRERGLAVPGDVLVTGFDDVWLGHLGETALTTVAQPFETLAEEALTLLLAELAGAAVAPVVRVPARLVIRRSCGCELGAHAGADVAPALRAQSASEHFGERAARVAALIDAELGADRLGADRLGADRLGAGRLGAAHEAHQLFEALRGELAGRKGAFCAVLEQLLREHRSDHAHHQALHNVIDVLRHEFHATGDRDLDDLWYRALGRIAHSTTSAGVEHRIELDYKYTRLLMTADRVSVALDLPMLADAIAVSLQNIGMELAFVSRFVDGDPTLLKPLVGLVDGARVVLRDEPFAAVELLPPGYGSAAQRRSLVSLPLVFETQWLGVVVFEYAASTNGYQMLRDQFAAALGHVTLHQQIVSKTLLHERSVQERQATTRRLEALSVLAGGVAHDLNNTLGPLIVLPDIVSVELERFHRGQADADTLEQVQTDIACMKSAGLRAAQTIKDLLTLGRQGRAAKESLDLNRVIAAELREPLPLFGQQQPAVALSLELYPEPLHVRASEAHIARAVSNLVRNAAEALDGRGSIRVTTGFVELTTAHAGYETIPAGQYATISVSDSGSGIADAEIGRVFEPFFSSKRLGEQSGSGLGLAIVHGVAKEHEGFVDLTSQLGVGTTFTLYFPWTLEPSRVSVAPRPTARGSARILVVDDDMQSRTARRVLVHLGYDVDVVESGAQALELMTNAEQHYDVLLIDARLNEALDGRALVQELRLIHPYQRVVLASGEGEPRAAERGTGVGWLAKPYSTESLAKAVEAALAEPASITQLCSRGVRHAR